MHSPPTPRASHRARRVCAAFATAALAATAALTGCTSSTPRDPATGYSGTANPSEPAVQVATYPAPARGALTAHRAHVRLTMHVGDRKPVQLDPPGIEEEAYAPITTSRAGVVTVEHARGGYPGTGPLIATLVARHPGTVRLRSITDQACFHMKDMCLPPITMWSATITVLA